MRKVPPKALFLNYALFLRGWRLLLPPKSPELTEFKTEWYHGFQLLSFVYTGSISVRNS